MIKWIFEKLRSDSTSIFNLEAPWGDRLSIYGYVESHLDPKTGVFEPGDTELPDDPDGEDDTRWAPGYVDNVIRHHSSGADEPDSSDLVKLIVDVARDPTDDTFAELYARISGESIIEVIDDVLDELASVPAEPHLQGLAVRLATRAPDRSAVKLGIALLGLVGTPEDEPILLTLGAHEEFTLFAVVAMQNVFEDPEVQIWELAKRLDGWGRLNTVERLEGTQNHQIKDWLLREGFRSPMVYEHLAFECAQTGDLAGALDVVSVDEELLAGAAEILDALLEPYSPARTIQHYHEAVKAIERFQKHLRAAPLKLTYLSPLTALRDWFVAYEQGDWSPPEEYGWTETRIESLAADTDALLARNGWTEVVRAHLHSGDRRQFHLAARTAPYVDIDPWPYRFERLKAGHNQWFEVMQTDSLDRVEQVLAYAEDEIELDDVAAGRDPMTELETGSQLFSGFVLLLQELRRFPGKGWIFIEAALKSPNIRHRNSALLALEEWPLSTWPDSTVATLKHARQVEPDEDVRDQMANLLKNTD